MPPAPTLIQSRPGRRAAWAAAACLCLIVAACADPKQGPAAQAIAEIEAALTSAGSAPAKYVPGELEAVQSDLAGLKQDFERHDYRAVLDAAPAVLTAARALPTSAAAREEELLQALRTEWAELVQTVPAELSSVAERFDHLASRKRLPAGLTATDVGVAKGRLRDALALWDRARQEAAAGRLPEAVTLANQVREMGRAVDAASGAGAADASVK